MYILKENGSFGSLQRGEFTSIANNIYCISVDGEEVVWGMMTEDDNASIVMHRGVLVWLKYIYI